MSTYNEFSEETASQKIALAKIEAAKRLVGWAVHSGSTYVVDFSESVIVSLRDSGVDLSSVTSIALITAGTYYPDRVNNKLYLQTSDSVDPNTKFMSVTFFLFFCNRPTNAPNDLANGFEVCWLPYISSVSQFKLQLDNKDINLGNAIEGRGSISLINDNAYWVSRYDKLIFENKLVFIYSWNLGLDITEAKLIFRGRIQQKSYSEKVIKFTVKDALNELREPFVQGVLGDVTYTHDRIGSTSALVPENFAVARQRTVYGRPNGVRLPSIDQIDTGYPVRGTFTVSLDATLVSLSGGNVVNEDLVQGDEIRFSTEPEKTYTIATINAAYSSIDLEEPYTAGNNSGATIEIISASSKLDRFNRYYFLTEHELSQLSTVVTEAFTARRFRVLDASSFQVGDALSINNETQIINAKLGGNVIETVLSYSFLPNTPDTVDRNPVRALWVDGVNAIEDDSFDVNLSERVLFLRRGTDSVEFKNSPVLKQLPGTLQFTLASSIVLGVSTEFDNDLEVGDFIQGGTGDSGPYYQVISITSDTSLIIATSAGENGSQVNTSRVRRTAGTTTSTPVSANMIGKPLDNISSNVELLRGPEIVKDIQNTINVTTQLNDQSFDDSDIAAPHDIGLTVPKTYNAEASTEVKKIINSVNRSIYGSLFQNADFELEYGIMDPSRNTGNQTLKRVDVVSWQIRSDARDIVSTVNLSYDAKEINEESLSGSTVTEVATSDIAKFLAETNKEFDVDTLLVDQRSARIFATRWVFLLELARGLMTLRLKLQAQTSDIIDKVTFEHPNLYERLGSRFRKKIGLVSSVERGTSNTSLTFDDLANAFSRCGAITENDARDFNDATVNELLLNGYITDNNGMVDNDPDTFGINVIW